jgi:hypothetical protein
MDAGRRTNNEHPHQKIKATTSIQTANRLIKINNGNGQCMVNTLALVRTVTNNGVIIVQH